MNCSGPGATHHLACDCREQEWSERLAASEKAREEAYAYAGRANARIADLGERLDATEAVLRAAEKARKEAERERDEARERAASLSRELLAAIQARDSYRASAELRVGMRREFEDLLGVRDTTDPDAFEDGLIRLRELVAAEKELVEFSNILARHNHEWSERCELAESRVERLEAALRRIEAECACDFPRCQSTIARACLASLAREARP